MYIQEYTEVKEICNDNKCLYHKGESGCFLSGNSVFAENGIVKLCFNRVHDERLLSKECIERLSMMRNDFRDAEPRKSTKEFTKFIAEHLTKRQIIMSVLKGRLTAIWYKMIYKIKRRLENKYERL